MAEYQDTNCLAGITLLERDLGAGIGPDSPVHGAEAEVALSSVAYRRPRHGVSVNVRRYQRYTTSLPCWDYRPITRANASSRGALERSSHRDDPRAFCPPARARVSRSAPSADIQR